MRSVTQDGVFNLLSAGVSLVALLGSLTNLLSEQVVETIDPDFNMTSFAALKESCLIMGGAEETPVAREDFCNRMQAFPAIIGREFRYPHSWVENVLTLLIGLVLFSVGMRELFYSTRVLHFQWWKARFWCASASREDLDGVLGDLSFYADTPPATLPTASLKVPLPTESTPLNT